MKKVYTIWCSLLFNSRGLNLYMIITIIKAYNFTIRVVNFIWGYCELFPNKY